MHPYLSCPYPFIIFFSFFSILFQVSYGDYDPNYTACSKKFDCGNITNISYPFWGKDRPEFCGHPGFQLNCQDDIVDMRIGSQIYHVLNITDGVHTLQIAPINDACPSPPRNISLPSDLFNYSSPINRNLVLAYGCQPYPDVMTAHPVYCPINKNIAGNYYSVASPTPDYSMCEFIVVEPILEKLVQNLTNMRSTVEDVLKQGFEVRYDGNASFCDRCENSGGQCGYNFTTIQPTCFCYNGEYPETCPTRPPSTIVIRKMTYSSNFQMKLS
ncbi:non-specific serine/threonine protein kinase [Ranunculus cassubicifolius]